MRWILIIGKTSALDIYFQYYALAGLYIIEGKNQDALNISSHHRNRVSTCHPCLEPEFSLGLSQLSFGGRIEIIEASFSLKQNIVFLEGFMGGWAALTVTDLDVKVISDGLL